MNIIRSDDGAFDHFSEAKSGFLNRFGGHFQRVWTIWEAMLEAHAAARRYHELTSRGMSHDKAAAKVFADHYKAR